MANDHNTIVIKLKAIDGFDFETIDNFQQEIVRQFQEVTGVKLPFIKRIIYNPEINCLIPKKGALDKFFNR